MWPKFSIELAMKDIRRSSDPIVRPRTTLGPWFLTSSCGPSSHLLTRRPLQWARDFFLPAQSRIASVDPIWRRCHFEWYKRRSFSFRTRSQGSLPVALAQAKVLSVVPGRSKQRGHVHSPAIAPKRSHLPQISNPMGSKSRSVPPSFSMACIQSLLS